MNFNRIRPVFVSSAAARGRAQFSRAFTIVEILIALGGSVVVAGLALSLYETTQSAAIKISSRQAAMDYAMRVNDQISHFLAAAISPLDLNTSSETAKAIRDSAQFANLAMSIPICKTEGTTGVFKAAIRPPIRNEAGELYRIRLTPLVPWTREGQPPSQVRQKDFIMTLGGRAERFTPLISFRYALEARPGQPVAYKESLAPGEWPILIELTLKMKLEDDPERPIVLQTSFIPGRIPAKRALAS